MIIFAVFQEGVYRHDCCGVFSKQELAEAAALQAAQNDKDNYHEYHVRPFELDEFCKLEKEVLFVTKKKTELAP